MRSDHRSLGGSQSHPRDMHCLVMGRGLLLHASLGIFFLAASTPAWARVTLHKTLEVQAPGVKMVVVEHPLGALTVRGWSRQTVLMKAAKRGPDEDTARRLRVHGELREGKLIIETRALMPGALPLGRKLQDRSMHLRQELSRLLGTSKPWSAEVRAEIGRVNEELMKVFKAAFGLSSGATQEYGSAVCPKDAELELTVYLPRGVRLEAKTLRGDIDAADLDGAVTLHSRHGRIFARNLAGGLHTRSDQGPQFLSTLRGVVDVDGLDGDLQLRGVRGERVVARLVKGAIVARGIESNLIRLSTARGGVTLRAVISLGGIVEASALQGNIDVHLEAPQGFQFEVRAAKGILSAPGLEPSGLGGGGAGRGIVGKGSGRVNLRTHRGDLKLR